MKCCINCPVQRQRLQKIPDTAEFQDICRKLVSKLHNDSRCPNGSSCLWPSELDYGNTWHFQSYIYIYMSKTFSNLKGQSNSSLTFFFACFIVQRWQAKWTSLLHQQFCFTVKREPEKLLINFNCFLIEYLKMFTFSLFTGRIVFVFCFFFAFSYLFLLSLTLCRWINPRQPVALRPVLICLVCVLALFSDKQPCFNQAECLEIMIVFCLCPVSRQTFLFSNWRILVWEDDTATLSG